MGGELKPSLDLVVTLPLDTNVFEPAAKLITKQPRVTVMSVTGPGSKAQVGKRAARRREPLSHPSLDLPTPRQLRSKIGTPQTGVNASERRPSKAGPTPNPAESFTSETVPRTRSNGR